MPRSARQAFSHDGLIEPQLGEGSWSPGEPSPPTDWNHAPNDRVAAADRQTRLARTLEIDIIPRLVNVHRTAPIAPAVEPGGCAPPGSQDVEDFVQLVLGREYVPAQAFLNVLVQRGMSVETVYLDLLAPAAQHLSYLWTQDLCDFTQVTLGLARMQRLLHELSPAFRAEAPPRGNGRRVLLLPARGEQQTFGLSMVAEFFHHAGWEVDCGGGSAGTDAARLVEAQWFDIVGFSAGIDTGLEGLKAGIRDLRRASRNPHIGVLVGGPIFAGHLERVKFVGADDCGLDGKQAPTHAERLVARRHPPRD